MRKNTESLALIEMEIGLFVVLLHSSFSLSRREERREQVEQEREGVWGITTVFHEVINKRISQSFSLSHFWPLGTAYMSALTGGDSLIIRPKTKESMCMHTSILLNILWEECLYYLLSFGCLYVRKFHASSLESLKGGFRYRSP